MFMCLFSPRRLDRRVIIWMGCGAWLRFARSQTLRYLTFDMQHALARLSVGTARIFSQRKIPTCFAPTKVLRRGHGGPDSRANVVFVMFLGSLEAQQRYFSYLAIFVAIVSQNSFVLVLWGIAQLSCDTLQNGLSHRCACVKLSAKGGYRTIANVVFILGVQKLTRGFGEGLLKDKFAFFEASTNPMPKRRNLLAKRPFL